jgi:hypothetical protein
VHLIKPKTGEKLEMTSHTHLASDDTDRMQAMRTTRENNAASEKDQASMNQVGVATQVIGPNVTTTMYRVNNVDRLHVDSGNRSLLPDVSAQGIVVDPPEPK